MEFGVQPSNYSGWGPNLIDYFPISAPIFYKTLI